MFNVASLFANVCQSFAKMFARLYLVEMYNSRLLVVDNLFQYEITQNVSQFKFT